MTSFINLLLYQVGWFCCVLGAAWGFPWLGMSLAAGLVAVHFWLTTDRLVQFRLVMAAAAIGGIFDTAQLWAGVFTFPSGVVVEWLPPPWMTMLWLQFATTFHFSMRWLSGRYALCACFGLLGAPLAFFAGERFGAIDFLSPRVFHYICLALLWSVAVPVLTFVSDSLLVKAPQPPRYRWT
jgi:hypothetical protein